jgi:hypothetical protein
MKKAVTMKILYKWTMVMRMTMMMKMKKTTKIIKLDIKFSNPNLKHFLTILCQITISFKYYLLKTNCSR